MICNPVVIKKSGGGAEWQELKLNGTQDVPMIRIGEPTFTDTFTLHFDQRPRAILFRTIHGGGHYYYSAFSFKVDNADYYSILTCEDVGIASATVSNTTIEGTFVSSSRRAEFLPIYN